MHALHTRPTQIMFISAKTTAESQRGHMINKTVIICVKMKVNMVDWNLFIFHTRLVPNYREREWERDREIIPQWMCVTFIEIGKTLNHYVCIPKNRYYCTLLYTVFDVISEKKTEPNDVVRNFHNDIYAYICEFDNGPLRAYHIFCSLDFFFFLFVLLFSLFSQLST